MVFFPQTSDFRTQRSNLPIEMMQRSGILLFCLLFCLIPTCKATELKVSADALERTLKTQLFNGEMGRHYLYGDSHSACFAYVENPHVTYSADRVVVHIHTEGKLGKEMAGRCLGIPLSLNTDVSFAPDAQNEIIGFKDARLEKLSDSPELNFFLQPFLNHKVPANMKINAADLIRKALFNSRQSTGYTLTLERLRIQSMQIRNNSMVVSFDGALNVN